MKTIYSHKGYVYCLNILRDGRLASCSDDKSKNTFNCEITILGHTDDVFYFVEMKDGFLISCSGSLDKSIRIWSISGNSYKSEYIIENAHEYFIMKVIILSKNRFGSISKGKCKIWKGNLPYSETPIIELAHSDLEHKQILQLKDKEIMILFVNCNIQLWDLDEYKYIKEIKVNSIGSSIVQIDDETLITGPEIVNIKTESITEYNIQSFYVYKNIIKSRDNRALVFAKQLDFELGPHDREFLLVNPNKEYTYKPIGKTIKHLINIDKHTFITTKKNYFDVWKY